MAEKKGKFAALAQLRQLPAEESEIVLVREPVPSAPPSETAERGKGRPPTGKRSNPDWKLYSHFLKRMTQRAAVARLQAADDRRDLSDVLQELLEDWLKT